MDRLPGYPYSFLFFLMDTNMDTHIIWMQKFISVFVLNGYGYYSNTESMDLIADISWIIKLYDLRIKYITK